MPVRKGAMVIMIVPTLLRISVYVTMATSWISTERAAPKFVLVEC